MADGLPKRATRATFGLLYEGLVSDLATKIVAASDELWEQGRLLYGARHDKDWSLTDCISFVLMEREKIVEALTADRHFEQAGFVTSDNICLNASLWARRRDNCGGRA